MSDAIVLPPGGGTRLQARGGVMFFKATGADTDGAFSLMERDLPVGSSSPPPHRHAGAEGFFVEDGVIRFSIDGRDTDVEAGGFVLVPKSVAHTFGNRSDAPARILIIHSPAADAYFEELDTLWSGPTTPSPEEGAALMRKHGLEPA